MSRKRKKRKPPPGKKTGNETAGTQGQIPFTQDQGAAEERPERDAPTDAEAGPAAASDEKTPSGQQKAAAQAYETAGRGPDAPAPEAAGGEAAGMMVPASLLREAEAKRDEYLALAKKTQADLENYRKRVQREMATLKRESLSDFLKEFFGALDDLDRAIAEGENKHDYETFHDGVKLVRGNLWKALEGAGVRTILAEGRPFDPAVHEALTTVPSSEHAPGTVLEVFQPGYALDDFVLRPAKVIVAAEPPQDDSSEE